MSSKTPIGLRVAERGQKARAQRHAMRPPPISQALD